jgi:phosphohistidine phosphatase SixA
MLRRSFLACLTMLCAPGAFAADADTALLQRLKSGGHVLVIRHAATVPGKGDPANFKLGDCSTQRNLSESGRADAARLGAVLREHGVPVGEVLASRWCRAGDTAQLAFGRVEQVPMLDSSGSDDEAARSSKLAAVRAYIVNYVAAFKGRGNLVLVTHETNVRELTGETPAQGEVVVTTPQADGSLSVVGRLGVQQSADAARKM